MGYIVFLITATFTPCFAGNSTDTLSLQSILYSLMEEDKKMEKERKETEKLQMGLSESINRMALAIQKLDTEPEEMNDSENTVELEESTKATENLKESKRSKEEETNSKWKMVLDSKNNSYVKELFENDKELQEWIKSSSELLFHVIQSNNLDMLEFFVKKGAMINAGRESTLFSPLHFAIIAQRKLNIIKFFLDDPKTNLKTNQCMGRQHISYGVYGRNRSNRKRKQK